MTHFTLNDIRSGYIVRLRNNELLMCMRVNQKNFTKILVNTKRHLYFSNFNFDSLKAKQHMNTPLDVIREFDIVEVYGLVNDVDSYKAQFMFEDSLSHRKLLWKEKKTLTIKLSSICKTFDVDDIDIIDDIHGDK